MYFLTLLCWSRKVVLGTGLSISWHLCDRGFLGYVVLHWLLRSRLQEKGTFPFLFSLETTSASNERTRPLIVNYFKYDKNMTNAVKKISSGVWYQHHWPWPQLLWQAGRQQPFPEQQAAASSPRLQVPRPFLAPPPSRTQAKFTPKLCRELKINFSKRKRPQCESADQQGQECQTDTREDSHVIIST